MRKHINCNQCDAEFKISYDLDENYYDVYFCPFCGAEINDEDENDDEEY